MQIRSNNIIINYTEIDQPYINNLFFNIISKYKEYCDFFETNLDEPIEYTIWNNIDDFRKNLSEKYNNEGEKNVGLSAGNKIEILTYTERIKIRPNDTIDFYFMTFYHELVHSFHIKCKNNKKSNWFAEGLACYLGSPRYEYTIIDCDIDLIKNKKAKYKYYYSMVKYMIENYSHDEILKYVKNDNIVIQDTEKIVQEANLYFKSKKTIK